MSQNIHIMLLEKMYIIARRAYCVEPLQKSMCVRVSVRPCRPTDRTHSNGPDLVTRNWVLPFVAPSRVTKTGSVRDASQFSDKKLGFAIGSAIESH